MEAIELQRKGPVAKLLINQPARRNAINRSMWRSIADYARQVAVDASIRAFTIESAVPGSFAAGADISEFEANYRDAATTAAVNAEIFQAIESVAQCPQPTLALIDGPCVGGGLALVLACDIRLCSAAARFAVTPSRLGLSYHPSDMTRLLRAVGHSAASEMVFSSSAWTADRALQAGLVNSVFEAENFDQQCVNLIESICTNSLDANKILKQTIADVESGQGDRYAQAEQNFTHLFASKDFLEGRDAFLEKRPALFPSHGSISSPGSNSGPANESSH